MEYTEYSNRFEVCLEKIAALTEQAKAGRVRNVEHRLLTVLQNEGGKTVPVVLAEGMGISRARVAVLLNALERKKYLLRTRNPNDKRCVTVTITEKGSEYLSRESGEVFDLRCRLFDRLGEADTKELLRLLEKLIGEA